eukprot:6018786-Prymnesium_polylepis.1
MGSVNSGRTYRSRRSVRMMPTMGRAATAAWASGISVAGGSPRAGSGSPRPRARLRAPAGRTSRIYTP